MTTTTTAQAPMTSTESSSESAADHGATRTALVTGASSGIGEDTARKLQALGYIVYGAARRTDRLQTLVADGVRPLAMDVTDDASMTAGVNRILEETGRIDVLVNNA
ncbi:SDR family NAD(P)-dependent oxidoreductase, partial [Actinomyces naeslundii]